MPNYGSKKYWDKRYKENIEPFDWLENYLNLRPYIQKFTQKNHKILNVGCGNALLQEEMYEDGYQNIYNIDISSVCIELMKKRSKNKPLLKYEVMDCTNLQYEDNYFDFVIDKSTIDALFCGKNSYYNVAKMLYEVQRVLKIGCYYLIISYGQPESRVFHFQQESLNFDISYVVLPQKKSKSEDNEEEEESPHYLYILKKKGNGKEFNWERIQQQLLQADQEIENQKKQNDQNLDNQENNYDELLDENEDNFQDDQDESYEEEEEDDEDDDEMSEEYSQQYEEKKQEKEYQSI